jgi:fibulin 1/2
LCTCNDGYELDYDGSTCTDINECLQYPCDPSENCINFAGHYNCVKKTCQQGFTFDDDYNCVNINECEMTPNPCTFPYTCEDTVGSYRCLCEDGFEVKNGTCVDVNECDLKYCMQRCNNTFGSYQCSCFRGFRLMADGRICSDIDECAEGSHSCASDQTCVNHVGGFRCEKKCAKKCKNVANEIIATTAPPCGEFEHF